MLLGGGACVGYVATCAVRWGLPWRPAIGFRWLLEEYASARRGVYLARAALIAAPILLASDMGWWLVVRHRRPRRTA
jgi:hypothetical protein